MRGPVTSRMRLVNRWRMRQRRCRTCAAPGGAACGPTSLGHYAYAAGVRENWTRSRSGLISQRAASSCSASLIAQRSGRAAPSCAGFAPFRSMLPVLSPIARSSLHLGRAQQRLCSQRGELRALVLDRAGRPIGRAALLDQSRGDAAHGRVGEVPLAGELQQRQPVALGVGAHPLELLVARLAPSHRGGTCGGRIRRTRGRAARRRGTGRHSRPRA